MIENSKGAQKSRHKNQHLLQSFYHSWCGLKAIFEDDIAFKQEVFLTVAIIPFALIFGASAIEKALLIGSWFLVLLMEIINSSIENVVDRISMEIHPISKKIKDMASAAVLISIINVIIVWAIILVGYIRSS
ncbi:MAG: diacylglycerol kinase [Gammaproteobacteria bacterium]|nr:diacylglycerol kinase [Gammaproteobacteria bacterium]